jgi:hypothetical protein
MESRGTLSIEHFELAVHDPVYTHFPTLFTLSFVRLQVRSGIPLAGWPGTTRSASSGQAAGRCLALL